jgi:hypothetical protein
MPLSLAFQNLPPQMRATILMIVALFMFTCMGIFIRPICGRFACHRGGVFSQCAGGGSVSAADHARWLVKHAHAKAKVVFPARSD